MLHPAPRLNCTPACNPHLLLRLRPCRGLLMASAEEAADKKAAFLGELAKVEAYLAAHGPFFGGDKLDATDASMAPKMYHALTALGEL